MIIFENTTMLMASICPSPGFQSTRSAPPLVIMYLPSGLSSHPYHLPITNETASNIYTTSTCRTCFGIRGWQLRWRCHYWHTHSYRLIVCDPCVSTEGGTMSTYIQSSRLHLPTSNPPRCVNLISHPPLPKINHITTKYGYNKTYTIRHIKTCKRSLNWHMDIDPIFQLVQT